MSRYWRKRELEHIKKMKKDDERIAKRLRRNHKRALKDIEKEIESFYGRYAGKEGITMEEARKRVAKADVEDYKSKAKEYVEEKNFSPRANEEMRLYNVTMRTNRLELLKAQLQLEMVASTNENEKILFEEMTKRAREEFERQSGILGITISYNEKKLKDIINSSFLNATWSDRIWDNQDALRSEVDRLMNRGIMQGKNPRELARDVRKKFDVTDYEAERLMRTEMARVQMDVFLETMEQGGFDQYEFIAEPDACDECAEIDGSIFNKDDMTVGENAPPIHPNCRCAMANAMSRSEWEKELEERGL